MDPGTAIVAAGGINALASGASIWGADKANKDNLKIAREQMAFQERMSNSAYQRAVSDMRLAGLNPLLAYGQGGASSPSGASTTMENIMSGASTGALDTLRLKKDVEEAQTRIDVNKQTKENLVADGTLKNLSIPRSQMMSEIFRTLFPIVQRLSKTGAKVGNAIGDDLGQVYDLNQNLENGFGDFSNSTYDPPRR